MLYDLHTHTNLSDGKLSVDELAKQAKANMYTAMAITDHVDEYNYQEILLYLLNQCLIASRDHDLVVLAGVELTGIHPSKIAKIAKDARFHGAQIIIVHGETLKEKVAVGTNKAAVECNEIDILAHPGLISNDLAKTAKDNNVHLELSSRQFHSITNGHVARVGLEEGSKLIVNSDTHEKEDLLTIDKARNIAIGSGLNDKEAALALVSNPGLIIKKALEQAPKSSNL